MNKNIFCDKCGTILNVKTIKGVKFGICNCGFVKEVSSDIISSEKEPKPKKLGRGIVIEKNLSKKNYGFPHKCRKCGWNESEVYDLGAPYSDEADVYLFKCKKCGYVEREAYGGGNK